MLEIDQVSKAFGGLLALSQVSFQINKGEIVGLIGPNGAGKTTLVEVLSGFHPPTRGKVIFQGKRLDKLKPHSVCREGLSRSFQVAETLPTFNVFDYVLFSGLHDSTMPIAVERTKETLKNFNLSDKAEDLVSALGPGDQKLAELARVVNSRPQLMLLDEITAGLSEPETRLVISQIQRLNLAGISFMIVEHRLEVIKELCHRVIVLSLGEKIAEGTPEEVMKDKKVIEAYLGVED